MCVKYAWLNLGFIVWPIVIVLVVVVVAVVRGGTIVVVVGEVAEVQCS